MKQVQFERIRKWAESRGIYEHGDVNSQLIKLMEEVGELSEAVLDQNANDFYDAIGDCVVVLTNLVELHELINGNFHVDYEHKTIESCINDALIEIEGRSGKMINGTFVKDE